MSDAGLMPNTFQKPNKYSDLYDYYLTPEESRVLDFFVRHILGWEKRRASRRNRLSISQVVEGWESEDGEWKTLGCGLGRSAVVNCISSLVEFGFLLRIGKPTVNGQEYELVLDDKAINLPALVERKQLAQERGRNKTANATTAKNKTRQNKDSGTCDVPTNDGNSGTSDVPTQYVPHTDPVRATYRPSTSDVHYKPILETNTKTHSKTKGKAADAAPPSKPVTFEEIQAVPTEARKPTQQQAEVAAWGEVMELDIHIPANANRVGNMLKGLRKSKDCPPVVEVARFRFGRTPPPDASWNFYSHTWQGEKGQPPTEREINQYWGAWLKPALKVMSNTNGHARAAPMSRSDRNRQILDEAMAEALGQSPPTGGAIVEGRVIRGHAS